MKHVAFAFAVALASLLSCTGERAARPAAGPPTVDRSDPPFEILYQLRATRAAASFGTFRVELFAGALPRPVELDQDGRVDVIASPDGRSVALQRSIPNWGDGAQETELAIASARDLKFRPIVRVRRKGSFIQGLQWTRDGSTIFYLLIGRDRRAHAYSIRPDGSSHRRIASFPARRDPFERAGVEASGKYAYWYEIGEGGLSSITVIDSRDGSVQRMRKNIRGFGQHDIVLSLDGHTLYRVGAAETVWARNLRTGRERVVYRAGRGDVDIQRILVAPDGKSLAIDRTPEEPYEGATLLVDVKSGRVSKLREDEGDYIGAVRWSPDGQFLWFEEQCCDDEEADTYSRFLMDVATRQTIELLGDQPAARVEFLAWLARG